MIMEGVSTRMDDIYHCEHYNNRFIYVSVESGIYCDESKQWKDITSIAMRIPHFPLQSKWSDATHVSADIFQQYYEAWINNQDTTVGKLMHQKYSLQQQYPLMTANDWHGVVHGQSRLYLMYKTLQQLMIDYDLTLPTK